MAEYPDIVEVKHLLDTKEVNDFLAKGWKLLGTSHGVDENSYPIVIYALGKEKWKIYGECTGDIISCFRNKYGDDTVSYNTAYSWLFVKYALRAFSARKALLCDVITVAS